MTAEELWQLGEEMRIRNNRPMVTITANDYEYRGWLVSVFKKMGGAVRCNVEDDTRRLMIHGPQQVTSFSWIDYEPTTTSNAD